MRNLPIPSTLGSLPPELIRLLQNIMNDRSISAGDDQPLTVASNAVALPVNFSSFILDASASADLKTINNGNAGDVVFFRITNNARVITFKHTGGNLVCNGGADMVVNDVNDLVMCKYDKSLAKWKCVWWDMG